MNIFEISLTNYCNFRCDYCISDPSRGSDKFSGPLKLDENGLIKIHPEGMLQEDYDRLKDTAHDSGDWVNLDSLYSFIINKLSPEWVITLTGGEPLYYPNISEFILKLSTTHKVVITSNISLIKKHIKLLSSDRSSVFFRVGYHPEFRSISEFISNMNYLINNGFNYIVNYVLHPKYYINSELYLKHIDILDTNQYQYEITPFEGTFEGSKYPKKISEMNNVEKKYLINYQKNEITISPMGNHFMLVEPNGKIFQCQGKNIQLGDIYSNHVKFTNQPMSVCFSSNGCSPARSADNYLKIFLNSRLSCGK